MVFVETPIFTRQVQDVLSEDQYRNLQDELRKHPGAGPKIKGSGGLRKLRWGREGQGKRGGKKIISYWELTQIGFSWFTCTQRANRTAYLPNRSRHSKKP